MLNNSGIKTAGWPVRFSSGSQHQRSDLYSEANLREILGLRQNMFEYFVDLKKKFDQSHWDKCLQALQDFCEHLVAE